MHKTQFGDFLYGFQYRVKRAVKLNYAGNKGCKQMLALRASKPIFCFSPV